MDISWDGAVMARIRSVKPEFWQHPKVTGVSRDARLLFLGLLSEADDEGRMRYSAKRLAGNLFPDDDDVDAALLERWVDELEAAGLLFRYDVDGAPLLFVCGFTDHQKISHPTDSRLPPPPKNPPPRDVLEPLTNDSGTAPETFVPEGNREQGEERNRDNPVVEETSTPATLESPPATPAVSVFAAWQESTGHRKAILDTKRRKVIAAALKHYPLDDLIDAVRGWRHFPHNRGENDQRTPYNSLELCLRDSEHIERFRDAERAGGNGAVKYPKSARALANVVRQ